MVDLTDYCHDYIESANSYCDPHVNKKVYDLCCEYIFGAATDKQREFLVDYFTSKKKTA